MFCPNEIILKKNILMNYIIPFCNTSNPVWLTYLVLLFVKNTTKEKMEMTTPVFTRKAQSDGVKMEMTTPVITTRVIFCMHLMLMLSVIFCMIKFGMILSSFKCTFDGFSKICRLLHFGLAPCLS